MSKYAWKWLLKTQAPGRGRVPGSLRDCPGSEHGCEAALFGWPGTSLRGPGDRPRSAPGASLRSTSAHPPFLFSHG